MAVINKRAETAAEIAERQTKQQLIAETEAARLDPWIRQFIAMTPSEAQTYVQNNTATLADMRAIVSRLAYAVRVLAKQQMR